MKKTKQKTKKKITTKSAFIYGLIGGFSIFAIFLLIVILIGYSSIPKTQSVNNENQSHNYPMEVQRALPPPNDYDDVFTSFWSNIEDGYVPGFLSDYSTSEGELLYAPLWTYKPSFNGYDLKGLGVGVEVFDYVYFDIELYDVDNSFNPKTYPNYMFYTDYHPLGRGMREVANNPMKITLVNLSDSPVLMRFDVSSSSSSITVIPKITYDDVSYELAYDIYHNNTLRPMVVMPYSTYSFTLVPRTSNFYLDAVYFSFLSKSPVYDNGYDTGYDTGYDNGYDAGYDEGYTSGLNDYASEGVFPPLAQSFNLIRKALGGGLDILSLEVMPGVSIFGLLLVPFVISLFWVVIKFLRG